MPAQDTYFPASEMRGLICEALPEETSLHGRAPEARFVYFPPAHIKALRPDCMVVSGMRGAGKSFWWAALQRPEIRLLVEALGRDIQVGKDTNITVGFGEAPNPDQYPGRDVLRSCLDAGHEPRLIWQAVLLHKLVPPDHPLYKCEKWIDRVIWVRANPERIERLLYERDRELTEQSRWHICLFDALDRSAGEWRQMHSLIRGLLQVALGLRPYERIRVKVFLREDQLDERQVADFPDASKVLSSQVDLTWRTEDLYGMLWQYLANSDSRYAGQFRACAAKLLGQDFRELRLPPESAAVVYPAPSSGADLQRQLFHALAGEWMGRDRRRGFTYTWIPNHLADAQGRTSPRSFLAALRAAAEDSRDRYPDHDKALHYESIKRGVQHASGIRVRELMEDYPWVDILMKPLAGLTVPCDFSAAAERWNQARVIQRIKQRVERQEERLPPAHLEEGPEGLRRDLEQLGVFLRLADGRINVPDVFRVGYGLGRRGGVRPVRRQSDS